MSMQAEIRGIIPLIDAPPTDAPRNRVAYRGGGWIGDILPLREDLFQQYPLLSRIDPYGYTLFNSLQVPFVIAELERRKSELGNSPESDAYIEALIALARECDRAHVALVFIGD